MTFNEKSDISSGNVTRRGPSRGMKIGGGAGGGAILLGIIGVLIYQFTGVDVSGITGQLGSGLQAGTYGGSDGEALHCTAAQANTDDDCRIQGAAASLDTYWAGQVKGYTSPAGIVIFDQQTATGCGDATTDVGPFYCPTDQDIYIDPAFYTELKQQFGDDAGHLAQLYVIGHEWGHHIQNITGRMDGLDLSRPGPASASVRLELQADCYAGAWIGDASTVKDENGQTFLEPVTPAQITDALDAAAAVGDDHIQESMQGSANPESFTHGTSAQRQKWFDAGLNGSPASCDTFGVPAAQL